MSTKRDFRKSKKSDVGKIVRRIAGLTLDKKAESVVVLDITKVSDAADYFVMVSGDTNNHVRSIADYVIETVKKTDNLRPWHIEGYANGTWILLDYIDFVLHVFEKETRQYYQLERLWGDAELVDVGA